MSARDELRDTILDEFSRWTGSGVDMASDIERATDGILAAGWRPPARFVRYVVIHVFTYGDGSTSVGTASSVYDRREAAENQLAYCEGMQAEGRPGSEGRYFIAEVYESSAEEVPS